MGQLRSVVSQLWSGSQRNRWGWKQAPWLGWGTLGLLAVLGLLPFVDRPARVRVRARRRTLVR